MNNLSLHVFIVEDDRDTLKWLMHSLESAGYIVSSARTMAEALETFPASRSHVLLSDIGLPDGDGWELLKKLKKATPPHVAIAMSGFGTKEYAHRSRKAGFKHYLLKPFDPEELNVILKNAAKSLKVDTETSNEFPSPPSV